MIKKIKYFLSKPLQLPIVIVTKLPYFSFIRKTTEYQCRINFETWFNQKVLGLGSKGNKKAYWPVHSSSVIVNPDNIYAGIDTCPGLMNNCYIQGIGKIIIDDYTQIAANVKIISANHDLYDTRKHIPSTVKIGKYCWIGAGATILPGVELGDFTIVGAGSIVTKSFENGHCVIAGSPAKLLKELDPEKCIKYEYKEKFYGYLTLKALKKLPNYNLLIENIS